jgi:peptide/nickel transport system ATP-binding protein/oligopeptide transport system ATP-binding protein
MHFFTREGIVKAVDGVSFDISRGEIMGLVGESGCGKSMTALSILRLVPVPGRIVEGSIVFEGKDLLRMDTDSMRAIRGSKISMIFQDPLTSLNPVIKIGEQIAEAIREKREMVEPSEAMRKALEMMELVGIPDAHLRMNSYPFQLSGGMRQRVMIAMALSLNPALLIADEPTTNLDVTIQAQILDLMRTIQRKMNTSVLLITHNLAIVAWLCDEICVMYAGNIMERGDTKQIFEDPQHPYTIALMRTIPRLDKDVERLQTIEGFVPNLIDMPPGCKFYPRCPKAMEKCYRKEPELIETESGRFTRCWSTRAN